MPYKLLSFRTGPSPRAGVLIGDTVYDAATITKVPAHASVLGILEDWARARRLLDQAAKRERVGDAQVVHHAPALRDALDRDEDDRTGDEPEHDPDRRAERLLHRALEQHPG